MLLLLLLLFNYNLSTGSILRVLNSIGCLLSPNHHDDFTAEKSQTLRSKPDMLHIKKCLTLYYSISIKIQGTGSCLEETNGALTPPIIYPPLQKTRDICVIEEYGLYVALFSPACTCVCSCG